MVDAAFVDELTNSGYTNIITRARGELKLRDQQNGNAFINQTKSDSLKTDILKRVVKTKSSCYIAA